MPRGWKGSTRKVRLPADWSKRRAIVLKRDAGRCQHMREDTQRICGLPATDVDHMQRGDDHRLSNLQALCRWHHLQKSSREGGEGNRKAAPAVTDHPGFTT